MLVEQAQHVIHVRLDAPTARVEVVAEFRGEPSVGLRRIGGKSPVS